MSLLGALYSGRVHFGRRILKPLRPELPTSWQVPGTTTIGEPVYLPPMTAPAEVPGLRVP